jgi:uncharacterized membrane protein
VAVLQTLGESALYYIHERVWLRIKPRKKAGISAK